jgi:aminoglycoside 6-adenylyltransferase
MVDELSDYDIFLVVQDINPFFLERTWINDFGEVLITYWDEIYSDPGFSIEKFANVIQYSSGLKIDFTLWPVSILQSIVSTSKLPDELDGGYKILMDKDHLTQGILPPTGKAYIPKQPTLDTYLKSINDFLSDAPYVAKCLWRNELMPAKWAMDYDMKQLDLKRMLEWRAEIEHGWSIPMGWLGKGLKRQLPPETWEDFEKTYVGRRLEDNWEALFGMMTLFRNIATEVGHYFGYSFPGDLHDRVVAYVQHIHGMEIPRRR